MNNRKIIIPNNLKQLRERGGYTQKQVATILGFTTEERICHWEKGRNIPNLINLFKLSTLYRATPRQMYPALIAQISNQIYNKVKS